MSSVGDHLWEILGRKGLERVFSVSGGMIGPLLDSLSTSTLQALFMHHEQACSMAAEGYARITGKPAVVLITNGPGVSNALTGVLGAYQDSIPMLIISGQVSAPQQSRFATHKLRQLGVQEVNTERAVEGFVKDFHRVESAHELEEVVSLALLQCSTGRPGPVWLELAIDIQGLESHIGARKAHVEMAPNSKPSSSVISLLFQELEKSRRPLALVGNGVHISETADSVRRFLRTLGIPKVATWSGADVFDFDDDLYVGNIGLLGERAANAAVQEADFLLILGSRLSVPVIGYDTSAFSPHSYKAMVDVDENEIFKSTLQIDLPIVSDLRDFIPVMTTQIVEGVWPPNPEWVRSLKARKQELSIEKEKFVAQSGRVDSYEFVKNLGEAIRVPINIVTDMGTSFTCTMQALRRRIGTRLFTSSGTSSMGFGLPGAIGASVASPGTTTLCIAGDGGLQMTVQELQTLKHHQLPVKIFVLNSAGYLAISLTQDNLFEGRRFGSDFSSGLSTPSFVGIAEAYGIKATKVETTDAVSAECLRVIIERPGPELIELFLPDSQVMRPRVMSFRDSEGTLQSPSLDQMWPDLETTV